MNLDHERLTNLTPETITTAITELADSGAGRELARSLTDSGAGLALAQYLTNSDAGLALAQYLTASAVLLLVSFTGGTAAAAMAVTTVAAHIANTDEREPSVRVDRLTDEAKIIVNPVIETFVTAIGADADDETLDKFDRDVLHSAANQIALWLRDPIQRPQILEAILAGLIDHFKDRPGAHDHITNYLRDQRVPDDIINEVITKLDATIEKATELGEDDNAKDGQTLDNIDERLQEIEDLLAQHTTPAEPGTENKDSSSLRKELRNAALKGGIHGTARKGAEEAIDAAGGPGAIVTKLLGLIDWLKDFIT